MNKLLACFLFSVISYTASSQKVYFVYLQTENEQPFYVRMDKTVYSSSASGYLILSKLRDTTYSFVVGFPQNKWPEQKFTVTINSKDHGFLVKNFGEKGWGLFDLQTLAVQMATAAISHPEVKPGTEQNASSFAVILSKAAADPGLLETQVYNEKQSVANVTTLEKENPVTTMVSSVEKAIVPAVNTSVGTAIEPKEDSNKIVRVIETTTTQPVVVPEKSETVVVPEPVVKPVRNDDALAEKKEETVPAPVVEMAKPEDPVSSPYTPSVVTKRSESSTTEGFGLVFIDHAGDANDTIRIMIPNAKSIIGSAIDATKKEEKKFVDITIDPSDSAKATNTVSENVAVPVNSVAKTIECKTIAEDNDFFQLRKSMAAVEGIDSMIVEANKYFQQKCFTTTQIKNLGTLFLDEDSRYKFFIAAHDHVSDKGNFISLQSEFKEDSYITRFTAIARN